MERMKKSNPIKSLFTALLLSRLCDGRCNIGPKRKFRNYKAVEEDTMEFYPHNITTLSPRYRLVYAGIFPQKIKYVGTLLP